MLAERLMRSELDFDTAIISASPLGLTEALLLAAEGKRVVVCDQRAAIGGAWRVESAFGYTNLEVGCHIFIPSDVVPVVIRRLWGVRLAPLNPPPRSVFYVRGRFLTAPYGSSLVPGALAGLGAIAHGGRWVTGRRRPTDGGLRALGTRTWKSLRLLREAVKARGRTPGPQPYPPGGTGEILRELAERVNEAGVAVRLDAQVIDARIERSAATLSLRDGSTIRAGEVVLTRGSRIETLNGLAIPARPLFRRHWLAVLDDPTPRAFSYLQFANHPAIERVSDVTSFAATESGDPVEAGRKIVCFYVTNALYERGRDTAEAVLLDLLKQQRWIGQDSRAISSGWWEDVESSRDYRSLSPLLSANPALRIVTEINLGAYLRNNVHRLPPTRPS